MSLLSIQEFIKQNNYDFEVEGLDGKWRKTIDRSGQKVWYIGTDHGDDLITFSFGDFRDKDKRFYFTSKASLSGEETKRLERFKIKVETSKEIKNAIAKEIVNTLWERWEADVLSGKLSPDLEPEYLLGKKIPRPPGVHVYPAFDNRQNVLVIPMRDSSGELWNIQQIYASGDKAFHPGAKVKGCFYTFGDGKSEFVLIGEGMATCAAAHLATGFTVICTLSQSNFEPAIKAVLEKNVPPSKIVILADFDGKTFHGKERINSGMLLTQKLSSQYQTLWTTPVDDFETKENVDFADLWPDNLEKIRYKIINPKPFYDLAGKIFQLPKDKPPKIEVALEPEVKPPPPIIESTPPDLDMPTPCHENLLALTNPKLLQANDYDLLSGDMLPDKGKKGSLKSTLRNFETILNHIGAVVRYNVIKKDEEWFIPGEEATLDNYKKVLFARFLDLCGRVAMPIGQIPNFLHYLCEQTQFNPVKVWIESKPWDGVPRLEEFFATIKSKSDEGLKKILMRKWMLSAIAAAMRPQGIGAPGFLVLQGPQYVGKTRWFMSLVPPELDLLAEGKMLDPTNKDSIKQIVCYWMVELGELDGTFKKSDLASLKAFITRQVDMFRPAYAQHESKFPRRTVFFGSVNHKEFLADETGNRRFWTIECEKVIHDHGLDMQQIWAEFYELYKKGEKWWLNDSEMAALNESNKTFETVEPIEELVRAKYDWEKPETGDWMKLTDILRAIGRDHPTRAEMMKISAVVQKINWGKVKTVKGIKRYWVPKPLGPEGHY